MENYAGGVQRFGVGMVVWFYGKHKNIGNEVKR